jgi:pyruvate/2-oxoacid:ferredoxin oxidoreductase beta subunit
MVEAHRSIDDACQGCRDKLIVSSLLRTLEAFRELGDNAAKSVSATRIYGRVVPTLARQQMPLA